MSESIFEEILSRTNTEGGFTASVLTSEDGLPVAAVPASGAYDANIVAAMVTLVKEFVQQTQTRLGLANVEEVSMVITDRSRLICRYFDAADHRFILTIIAPPDQPYRRLTSRAIREVIAAWK